MPKVLLACTILLATVAHLQADGPAKIDSKKTTSATYLITGLHCPPCTKVVEGSIAKVPGVKSIKVDWDTKNAKIEFDESVVPAERVAQLIAATPHMMGPSMHYDSWLALKSPDVKDDASAKAAKEALSKVAGVKKAEAFPKQHVVEIQFATDGNTTSAQLIQALANASIKAENY
jgi:copper chaperone CopZ